MWNILTTQIRENICDSIERGGLLPEEDKGCQKRTIIRGGLSYKDQRIGKTLILRKK